MSNSPLPQTFAEAAKLADKITATILAEMTPEEKEKLIAESVTRVLSRGDSSMYGTPKSFIEKAFDNAVTALADQMARDYVFANEKLRTALLDILQGAATKAMLNHAGLKTAMVKSFARTIESLESSDD